MGLNTLSDKPPMVSKCRGTPINGVMVCMKRGRSGALEALLCTGWGLGICSIALLQSSPINSPPGFKLVGRLRDGGVTICSSTLLVGTGGNSHWACSTGRQPCRQRLAASGNSHWASSAERQQMGNIVAPRGSCHLFNPSLTSIGFKRGAL